MSTKKSKIIVIGGGASGAMAALAAAEHGADVMLFTALSPRRSRTAAARDGIAAALDTKGEGDSPDAHAMDTIVCGDFLAHHGPVKKMCAEAPSIVHLLDRMGVVFDRTEEGTIDSVSSSGSLRRRVATAAGATGQQVIAALDGQLRRGAGQGRIHLFEGWEFLSLVIDDSGACRGVVVQRLTNMEIKAFAADAVILCTGGYAGLFGRHSTDRASDGSAAMISFAQGAAFANPEFIQLTPLAVPLADKCMPIGDPLLGIGARISAMRDGKPWAFIEEWFPKSGGKVPHDVAVRAVSKAAREMGAGAHDLPDGFDEAAFLDFTDCDPERLAKCFGDELRFIARASGADLNEAPLLIVPAVSQSLGGLMIDAHHATTIKGLFAAGDCACLYHGACLMPGNGLAASIHGGMTAGSSAVEFARGMVSAEAPVSLLDAARTREEDKAAGLASQEGGENAHLLRREMEEALRPARAIIKDNKELESAAAKIVDLKARLGRAAVLDRAQWANSEISFMRRMSSRMDLARMILAAQIARNESRGVHFKPEFPARDDAKWQAVTKVLWSADGPSFDYSERIEMGDVKAGERKY